MRRRREFTCSDNKSPSRILSHKIYEGHE